MYKGPHLADYCTRCSTSALSYGCSVDINTFDYICMYIIILYYYIAAIYVIREILIRLTSSASTMLLPPL